MSLRSMNRKPKIFIESFPKILGWLALLVWLSFIYLFLQYDATRPTAPIPSEGRVYAQNNHGHITYLNRREEDRLTSLEIAAASLFLVGFLTDHFQRHPRQIREIRVVAARTFEDVFDLSAWYAAVSALSRLFRWENFRSAAAVLTGQKKVSLRSELNVTDCRTRLEGAVGFNTVGPVLGSVKGKKLHLYIARKDFQNSFAPHFHGKLGVAVPSGTTIEGEFRMHFFVKIFLSIWFSGLIAIGGKMAFLSIRSLIAGRPIADAYFGILIPALFLLFGVLLVYWGKRLGSDDESQILEFLQHALKSRISQVMNS